jgi:hypothetical protein
MEKAVYGLCLGLAVALVATGTALAADIVVMRGSSTEVVSISAGGGSTSVTVLRGTPRKKTETYAERREAKPQPVAHGVQGTGENLWTVDSRGRVRACWLTGTGYVNSLRVVCTR